MTSSGQGRSDEDELALAGIEVERRDALDAIHEWIEVRPFLDNIERYGLIPDPKGPGNPFGLPVGINGTRDFKERYAQGVRLFFDIGPAFAGGGPSLTAEERKAVGR